MLVDRPRGGDSVLVIDYIGGVGSRESESRSDRDSADRESS